MNASTWLPGGCRQPMLRGCCQATALVALFVCALAACKHQRPPQSPPTSAEATSARAAHPEPTPERQLALLIAQLKSDQGTVRVRAAEKLRGHGERALPRLIELLYSAGFSNEAGHALAHVGLPAVPMLTKALSHSDPEIRLRAAWVLSLMAYTAAPALPQLIRNLRDPVARVRRQTAVDIAFVAQDDSTPVASLVALLDDPDDKTQEQAVSALEQIGPAASDAVGPLVRKLGRSNATLKYGIIKALGEIGPAAAGQANRALLDLFHDGVFRVISLRALVNINPGKRIWHRPLLIALRADDATLRSQGALVVSFQTYPDSLPKEALSLVTGLLDDPEERVRLSALEGLRVFGTRARPAIGKVQAALRSSSESTVTAAIDALAVIDPTGARTFDELATLVERYGRKSPDETNLAAKATEAIATLPTDAPVSLKRLQSLLESTTHKSARVFLALALYRRGLSMYVEPALDALLSGEDDEMALSEQAKFIAENLLHEPFAARFFAKLAASSDDLVRDRALSALSRTRAAASDRNVALMIDALDSPSELVRRAATDGLATLALTSTLPLPALEALARALGDSSIYVRWGAILALGEAGPAALKVLPQIEPFAEQPISDLAAVAIWAMDEITAHDGRYQQLALRKVTQPGVHLKTQALRYLRKSKVELKATEPVERLLTDRDESIRLAAAMTLLHQGVRVNAMRRLLRGYLNHSSGYRAVDAAVALLGHCDDPRVTEAMTRAIEGTERALKVHALESMADVTQPRPPWLARLVARAKTDVAVDVRSMAEEVLQRWARRARK